MKTRVFILATCRKQKLLPATLMVFETLRVGFPKAEIHVANNEVGTGYYTGINAAAARVGASVRNLSFATHQDWVEGLCDIEDEPFYICDTDIAFWKSVEGWQWTHPLAGRWIPEFYDPWSRMIVQPRLHTSLLYIDPVRVREAIEKYYDAIPDVNFMERPNLFASRTHPVRHGGRLINEWSDTCALLSRVVPGQCFNEAHLECYDHLNAGTWLDVVGDAHPGLRVTYDAALTDINSMRGLWRRQEEFYRTMTPIPEPPSLSDDLGRRIGLQEDKDNVARQIADGESIVTAMQRGIATP